MIDMICYNFAYLKQLDISEISEQFDASTQLNRAIVEQEEIVCIYGNNHEYLIFTTEKIIIIRKEGVTRRSEFFNYMYLTNRIFFFKYKTQTYGFTDGDYNPMEIHTEFGAMKLSFIKDADIAPLVKYIAGLVH